MLVTTDHPQTTAPKSSTHYGLLGALKLFAALYTFHPKYKRHLGHGNFDFSLVIRTQNREVDTRLEFKGKRVRARVNHKEEWDAQLVFKSPKAVKKLLKATPTDQVFMVMKSELMTLGNGSCINCFFYLLSRIIHKKQRKTMALEKKGWAEENQAVPHSGQPITGGLPGPKGQPLSLGSQPRDPGVKYLEDPFLPQYQLKDFPRLKKFLDIHFTETPEVCIERPLIFTQWFKEHGFETQKDGKPWEPVLRQGHAFKYYMENKAPIIGQNDLLAGTSTTKKIGVIVYPDAHGATIWGELLTLPHRNLNPYGVSPRTRDILHREVFPFWARRNFKEWVRQEYDHPLCQTIDERFAVYFVWKQAALSHTIPDFPKILERGTRAMVEEIKYHQSHYPKGSRKAATLEAMVLCLEGLTQYAHNLATQAEKEAKTETNPKRKKELQHLAKICARVPEYPAQSLDDAVNALWLTWVGLHMENTNA
ncbi:MAG: hypothetical protein MI749_01680, partial [Desulfovibrionales bacterium]|nr:hypothetical protein [Desulfovibrionales bacterium]